MFDEKSPTFTVALSDDGSVAVLTVIGDLDYSWTTAFQTKLNDVSRRARKVVIDVAAVGYMDSSSVRLMLMAARDRDAGTFALRRVGGALLQQLRFTGVLDLLEVEPDPTEP